MLLYYFLLCCYSYYLLLPFAFFTLKFESFLLPYPYTNVYKRFCYLKSISYKLKII